MKKSPTLYRLAIALLACILLSLLGAYGQPSWASPAQEPERQSIPTLTPTFIPSNPVPPPPPTPTPDFIPTLAPATPAPTSDLDGPTATGAPAPSATTSPERVLTLAPAATHLPATPTREQTMISGTKSGEPAVTATTSRLALSLEETRPASPGGLSAGVVSTPCQPCSVWPAALALVLLCLVILVTLVLVWRWQRA